MYESVNSSIDDWGPALIERPVWFQNNAYKDVWYADQERSMPRVLVGGDFATKPTSATGDQYAAKITRWFSIAALAYIWTAEKVIIIRVAEKTGGTAPCDLDWDALNTEATCVDGKAYVFHKLKTGYDRSFKANSRTLDKAPGISNVNSDDYDFKLEDLIRAAEDAQQSGGFQRKWTADDAAQKTADNFGKDIPIFFNLPICYLDDVWDGDIAGTSEMVSLCSHTHSPHGP